MNEITIRKLPLLARSKVQEFRNLVKLIHVDDMRLLTEEDNKKFEQLTDTQISFLEEVVEVTESGVIYLNRYEMRACAEEEKEIAELLCAFLPTGIIQALSFIDGEDNIYGFFFINGSLYACETFMDDDTNIETILNLIYYSSKKDTDPVAVFKAGYELASML